MINFLIYRRHIAGWHVGGTLKRGLLIVWESLSKKDKVMKE